MVTKDFKDEDFEDDSLLRVSQIIPSKINISKSGWWAGVRAGKFPAPVKLGERTTCWRSSDIQRIIRNGIN